MRGNFITDRTGNKNPNYKHGLKGTRLFRIWTNIKSRCNNSKMKCYKCYGARGIKLCDEWYDFKNFYDWSIKNGYNDNLTIDRINNNGNYEPSNCRWTTAKMQARNTRRNHLVTINGITLPLINWCEKYKINYHTVQDRLRRKWDIEKALSCPVDVTRRKKEYKSC